MVQGSTHAAAKQANLGHLGNMGKQRAVATPAHPIWRQASLNRIMQYIMFYTIIVRRPHSRGLAGKLPEAPAEAAADPHRRAAGAVEVAGGRPGSSLGSCSRMRLAVALAGSIFSSARQVSAASSSL